MGSYVQSPIYIRQENWIIIRRSPTMNVVSNVIVFYVVFCAKKYMSSFLTFQICDIITFNIFITNYGYVFQHSPM